MTSDCEADVLARVCTCEKAKEFDALCTSDKCLIINEDQSSRRIIRDCAEKHIVKDECFLFLRYVDAFAVKLCLAQHFWHLDQSTRLRILKETTIDPFLMPDVVDSMFVAFGFDKANGVQSTAFLDAKECACRDIRQLVVCRSSSLWFWYPGLRRSFYEACIRVHDLISTRTTHSTWIFALSTFLELAKELFPDDIRVRLYGKE